MPQVKAGFWCSRGGSTGVGVVVMTPPSRTRRTGSVRSRNIRRACRGSSWPARSSAMAAPVSKVTSMNRLRTASMPASRLASTSRMQGGDEQRTTQDLDPEPPVLAVGDEQGSPRHGQDAEVEGAADRRGIAARLLLERLVAHVLAGGSSSPVRAAAGSTGSTTRSTAGTSSGTSSGSGTARRCATRSSLPPARRSRRCCVSSMARVIGPTPPGFGETQPATSATSSATSPAILPVHARDADVEHGRAGLDHVAADDARHAGRGDDDVGRRARGRPGPGCRCGTGSRSRSRCGG